MPRHPYDGLPDHAFWRRAVSDVPGGALDPVVDVPFRFGPHDKVATAGSCFAQHIGRYLASSNCTYLITEAPHPVCSIDSARLANYGLFTARYGNVYTARQLRQLFARAYGTFTPVEDVWRESDRSFIDPFRPNIQPGGFNSEKEYRLDREQHFRAVRQAFETLDVFVFTLGLTEAWHSREDGAVFPLCPGVAGGKFSAAKHAFVNFGVTDIVTDMTAFIADLRNVNPRAKIILTVSPVPLVATAEPRHVLVSTFFSKSVLRVAAEMLAKSLRDVAYFPSYEIVMTGADGVPYFAADRRSVTENGVAHVMRVFSGHFLKMPGPNAIKRIAALLRPTAPQPQPASSLDGVAAALQVMCDEEALDWAGSEKRRVGTA